MVVFNQIYKCYSTVLKTFINITRPFSFIPALPFNTIMVDFSPLHQFSVLIQDLLNTPEYT